MNAFFSNKQIKIFGVVAMVVTLAGVASVLGVQKPAAPSASDAIKGHIPAPPGSETLTATLEANTVQLFEANNYEGSTATLNASDAAPQSGGLRELPHGLADSLTSLRWNVEPGVVVVFYEDSGGKGEQLIIWGKGQSPDISRWDFNDKASRWTWYDVGGSGMAASAGGMRAPHGAQPLSTSVPENTIQFFVDKNFENDMKQVSPMTAEKHGELHAVPSHEADRLTSLRWNLPEGVIVMLYQDAGGKKQQVAIWGEGQVPDLDIWDFNDKVSRWSWAYVGAAGTPKPEQR
jgi:hypothetical protein